MTFSGERPRFPGFAPRLGAAAGRRGNGGEGSSGGGERAGGGTKREADLDYFFFGTLMDREVLELVLGRRVEDSAIRRAHLDGYRLLRAADDPYPALVPAPGERVSGIVVSGLDDEAAARLEWFEGTEYQARPVEVALDDGGRVTALIQSPTEVLDIGDEEWTLEDWAREEKPLLLALTRAHMALMGKVGIDEAIRRWDALREKLLAERGAKAQDGPAPDEA